MDFFVFGLEQKLDLHSCVEFYGDSDGDSFKAQKLIIDPLIGPKNGHFQTWTRIKIRPSFLCRISWRFGWRGFQSPKTDN